MPESHWSAEEIYLVAQRGYELLLEGKVTDALCIFEGLIVVAPEQPHCRRILSGIYLQAGEPAKALVQADWCLTRDAGDAEARARRCEALMALGRRSEAARELDGLKRSAPARLWRRLELRLQASN